MVRGQRVDSERNLVPYNVRLEPEIKQILWALGQVQKLPGGQRELVNLMLGAYREKYPAVYQKALEMVNIINREK